MIFVKQKMKQSIRHVWCVVFGLALTTPTLASAEPWLKFCEAAKSCGYKTASNEVKIEPRHLYTFDAPNIITDEMRLANDLRIMYFPDEKTDDLVGYIDARGEVKIPPIYKRHFGTRFSHGYAIVKKDGLLRVINKAGELSKLKAERINPTPSNPPVFFVRRNDSWEITDFDGKSLNGVKYSNLTRRHETERFVFEINDKFGVGAYSGEEVLPAIYDRIKTDKSSIAIVEKNGQKALFNILTGQQITDFIYDEIYLPRNGPLEENALVVVENGKMGIIDYDGSSLMEPKYNPESYIKGLVKDRLKDENEKRTADIYFNINLSLGFSDGRALFFVDKEVGYLDRNGAVVIPSSDFIHGEIFNNGTAKVGLKSRKKALIDKNGKIILKGYRKLIRDGEYLIYCKKERSKCGLINNTGQVLIKPNYHYLSRVYNDEFTVVMDKKRKKGLLKFDNKVLNTDSTIKEVVPSIFDSVEVAEDFVFVTFGDQMHPMLLDGTPVGFSLSDVASAEK